MSAYMLLCDLRRRGIRVEVEGGRLESGRWRGGKLVVVPGSKATGDDLVRLREVAREVRCLLPYMLAPAEIVALERRRSSVPGGPTVACRHCGLPNPMLSPTCYHCEQKIGER